MTSRDDLYDQLWGSLPDTQAPPMCPLGQQFNVWKEGLCSSVEQRPDPIAVAQAKLQLLDKYFEFRTVAPKSCRNRMVETGHRCLWHVFESAYVRLRTVELKLTPPMLFIPEPPPPPKPPTYKQVGGIIIMEEDQEE